MAFLNVDQLRFGQGEWQLAADFEIERHSLTVVIGASGAGKSTLLALIAGFEQATAGRIVLDGIDVTQLPPSSRSITTLFQDHNLFAHLSLKDNIALARHPGLKLSIDDWRQVDQAIARVGLENIAQRRPGEVSGGQAQRAALARCLCQERTLLLLDEPFTGLDPARRAEMFELIDGLRQERGLTILLVSHNPQETRYSAASALFLHQGQIKARGQLSTLLESPPCLELTEYLDQAPPARSTN